MCAIVYVLFGADVRSLCAIFVLLTCTIAVNFYIYFEQMMTTTMMIISNLFTVAQRST